MKYYLYRLTPPRKSFPADIKPDEAVAMKEHVAYWTELASRGIAVVFGPVADPAGTWGVAIVEVETDEHIRSIAASDPAIKQNLGFTCDVLPMSNAVLRSGPKFT